MDHDVYTTNDAIGLVYVDLSPLFMRTAEQEQDSGRDLVVQGWFPLYDTLRGVRGALCLIIKVGLALGVQWPGRGARGEGQGIFSTVTVHSTVQYSTVISVVVLRLFCTYKV